MMLRGPGEGHAGAGCEVDHVGASQQVGAHICKLIRASGGGEAAPATRSAVEDGEGQKDARGLAGEAADEVDAAVGLAKGPPDEVGVPVSLVVPDDPGAPNPRLLTMTPQPSRNNTQELRRRTLVSWVRDSWVVPPRRA